MRNLLTALCILMLFPLLLSAQGDVSYGGASMYADAYHGRPTASGEPYDKNKLTGAHKTLPFGTIVKVTRLDNKKSIEVRINDRGPFIKGRVIDLSRKAAEKLDMVKAGVVEVKVEVSGKGRTEDVASSTPKPKATTPVTATAKPKDEPKPDEFTERSPLPVKEKPKLVEAVNKPVVKEKVNVKPEKKETPKPKVMEQPKSVPVPAASKATPKEEVVTAKDFKTYDLYKVEMVRPAKKGFGVQVATFTEYENVMRKVAELQGKWFKNILVSVEEGAASEPVYKIILGPFDDRPSADNYKTALKKNKKIDGFVVNLAND